MIKSHMSNQAHFFTAMQPVLFFGRVSACGTAAFKSVPEAVRCSAAPLPAESAVGLFLTEAKETYMEKVHASTRRELPAQTAEYGQVVKTCCHSNK